MHTISSQRPSTTDNQRNPVRSRRFEILFLCLPRFLAAAEADAAGSPVGDQLVASKHHISRVDNAKPTINLHQHALAFLSLSPVLTGGLAISSHTRGTKNRRIRFAMFKPGAALPSL